MDYPKSVPGVGLVDGKFIDENTTTGQVGSLIPCSWGNAVTDELLNVIRAGGEDPVEGEHDQLVAAIRAIVLDTIPEEQIRTTLADYGITDAYTKSVTYTKTEIEDLLKNLSALPVGAMVPFPKGTVPTGFLEVDGSVKSAATYPDLSTYLGTTYNIGDEGAGNFRLPDSRGEFFRGWDHGRGVDVGRAIGSYQGDAIRNITGNLGILYRRAESGATTGVFVDSVITAGLPASSSSAAGLNIEVKFDASDSVPTAAENRPRSLAVMWCIKAWNAPANQGQIDIAALVPLAAQATEVNQGTAKVATAAQMLDPANDAVMATPKKLRKGFAISLAANGYIAFPTWLGGMIFQWGTSGAIGGNASANIPFTIEFPNAVLNVSPSRKSANVDAVRYGVAWSATKTALTIWADDNGVDNVSYFAVGY